MIRNSALLFVLLLFIGSIFFVHYVRAASQTLTISNIPVTIDQSQEMNINIQFSCPSCSSDSYLRGVFYPSGTSYFGYTQDNSGAWSNAPGANCTSFLKVAGSDLSQEGTWSGVLRVKPDIANSYYAGPGEYLFKVGRYTPSCNSASVWSTEATIAITGPTPTSTPVPTATPTNTTTPIPTSTCTLTPSRTPTPTRAPTVTPILIVSADESTESGEKEVLGDEITPTKISVATPSGLFVKPMIISIAFVGLGLAILSGVFVWKQRNIVKDKTIPD